jgi:bacteriocin-like protein
MKKLSNEEMKKVMGGSDGGNYCGSESDQSHCCNVYCGQGSGVTCSGTCGTCDDALNGQNPNVPGGDKMCFR